MKFNIPTQYSIARDIAANVNKAFWIQLLPNRENGRFSAGKYYACALIPELQTLCDSLHFLSRMENLAFDKIHRDIDYCSRGDSGGFYGYSTQIAPVFGASFSSINVKITHDDGTVVTGVNYKNDDSSGVMCTSLIKCRGNKTITAPIILPYTLFTRLCNGAAATRINKPFAVAATPDNYHVWYAEDSTCAGPSEIKIYRTTYSRGIDDTCRKTFYDILPGIKGFDKFISERSRESCVNYGTTFARYSKHAIREFIGTPASELRARAHTELSKIKDIINSYKSR